jgi:hypothetical protein
MSSRVGSRVLKPSEDRFEVARALSAALEPLADICLQIGVNSPEFESLVRVVFVQRALARLPKNLKTGRGPTHEAIALASGLNRNDVRSVLESGAKLRMKHKETRHSKTARVLTQWASNPRFLSANGTPLDLPVELQEDGPSFQELVEHSLPGKSAKMVLKDLRRRGVVQLLADEIVRYRTESPLPSELNAAAVAHAAEQLRLLGEMLFQSMTDSKAFSVYATTKALHIQMQRLDLSRPAIIQRTTTYLRALEQEFGRAKKGKSAEPTVGFSVFSWKKK